MSFTVVVVLGSIVVVTDEGIIVANRMNDSFALLLMGGQGRTKRFTFGKSVVKNRAIVAFKKE